MSDDRIALYQGFVDKDPNNAMAWYVLAQEYGKRGDTAAAMAAYGRVIAIDPRYVAAYYHGAVVLQAAGEVGEARDLLARGLAAAREKGDGKSAAEMEELLQRLE